MKKKIYLEVALFTLFASSSSIGFECDVDPTGMDVCADQIIECESSPTGICVVKTCQEPVPDGNPALPCKL